jgi:hypothetical protein
MLTGCTFWALDGGGPVSKEFAYRCVTGRDCVKMSPKIVRLAEDFASDTEGTSWRAAECDYEGRKITYDVRKARHGFLLWGEKIEMHGVTRSPGSERTLYDRTTSIIPGVPIIYLWWQSRQATYSMNRREEVGRRRAYGLGLGTILGGYNYYVRPAGKLVCSWKDNPYMGRFAGAELTNEQKYNVKTGWHLAMGALAGGRVNKRIYFQILWIPIPLWSSEG